MIDLLHPNRTALLDKWGPKLIQCQDLSQWTTFAELCWLAEAASRAERICEVGSYRGKSAKSMSIASDGVIYCVDRFQDEGTREDFERNLRDEIEDRKVALTPLESEEAMKVLKAAGITFDMLFIDASHAKEDVLRDIRIWMPMMEPGALIAFHDCHPGEPDNGVSQALAEVMPGYHLVVDSLAALYT